MYFGVTMEELRSNGGIGTKKYFPFPQAGIKEKEMNNKIKKNYFDKILKQVQNDNLYIIDIIATQTKKERINSL